jgi:diguanylate cyclase
MEQEFARWKRYHQPLVLLIFDIDHFKRVNDTYGHKAGDKALKLIARTLQNNLRESDFLARFGGEEFVVLMPQTELNAAIGAANKLREAVEANQFHYQQKRVLITISCGATQFKDDDTIDSAFQRADQALYKAKQNGRNRCEAW